MSSSSSMGSALSYNEEKVKEGEAEVIAEVNVDSDHLSIRDTFARLETMNIRSKDVSFIVQALVISLDIIFYDPRCNGALDYALRLSSNRRNVGVIKLCVMP